MLGLFSDQFSSLQDVAVSLNVTESLEQELHFDSIRKDQYVLVHLQLVPTVNTILQRNRLQLASLRYSIHNELVARDVAGIQLHEEVYIVPFSGLASDTVTLTWDSLIYAGGTLSGPNAWVTGDVLSVYYVDFSLLYVLSDRPFTGQSLQPS